MDLGLGVCYFFAVLSVLSVAKNLFIDVLDLKFYNFIPLPLS